MKDQHFTTATATVTQGAPTRRRWALSLCVSLGVGMAVLGPVSAGWEVGGYRRVGADSWKLALTVAAVALFYRLAYAMSSAPGMMVRVGVGVVGYVLAAAAIGLWHGGSNVAVHHLCMWGLLLVLGMVGVELLRWRKPVGAGA